MKKKIFHMFRKNTNAGISAYVMILFGMIIMMHLFGYVSMWEIYSDSASAKGVDEEGADTSLDIFDISHPINMGTSFIRLVTSSIYATLVSVATITGLFIIGYWFRTNTAIWGYIIPAIMLVVLNIFVFPISELSKDMSPLDAAFTEFTGFSITIILLAFFNLFYLLAVIEFIRGGSTT